MGDLPKSGEPLRVDGTLVTVEKAKEVDGGVDLIVRSPDGKLMDRSLTWAQLISARVPENDGQGDPAEL